MPNWWSFLIFWVLMMGTIHAAHISASVYETESILTMNKNHHFHNFISIDKNDRKPILVATILRIESVSYTEALICAA